MRSAFSLRALSITAVMLLTLPCILPSMQPGQPAWKAAIARAWRYHHAQEFPNSRLAIRQACAHALEEQDWRGVYEGFVILGLAQAMGEPIPGYFFSYLRRAAALPVTANSPLASRLLAELHLVHNDRPGGIRLALQSASLSLDRGAYGDALEAARLLRPAKNERMPSEDSMQAWLAIARTCLAAQAWHDALAAARLMLDAGISGLARDWINRSAALALASGDTEAVLESASLLRASGHPDEAAVWEDRLNQNSLDPAERDA